MIKEWECSISNFGARAVLIKDWIQGVRQRVTDRWKERESLQVEEDTVQARVWNAHPQAIQSLQKVGVQGKPRNLLRHIPDEGGAPARWQTTVEEQWCVHRSSCQISWGGLRGSDTRGPGSISGNKDSAWPHLQAQRSRHVREGKCLGDRLQGKGRNFPMRLHT